jgi:hypothetical protein
MPKISAYSPTLHIKLLKFRHLPNFLGRLGRGRYVDVSLIVSTANPKVPAVPCFPAEFSSWDS